MSRLLVTGASGYVGGAVARCALRAGHRVTGTYHRAPRDIPGVEWRRLDARDRAAAHALVGSGGFGAVVNASSSADLDDWACIADGAANVAVAAGACGVRLVHLSSDAVFSGKRAPYDESALPEPVNRYGAAKAAAETVVRAVDPTAVVARTSLVMGDGRSKHERFSLDLTRGRIAGALFADEIRSAVHPDDLAAALVELATGDFAGVIHLGGADALDRHALGCLVAAREGLDPADVPRGRGSDLGIPRAADTTLDSGLAGKVLAVRLRGAREFLAGR